VRAFPAFVPAQHAGSDGRHTHALRHTSTVHVASYSPDPPCTEQNPRL
jgi:hypothetical protein